MSISEEISNTKKAKISLIAVWLAAVVGLVNGCTGAVSSTAAGQLSVSPSTFNFGSVVDGQTKSQSFTITNTGNASVTISQVAASGTGYSVSGLTTPATVAAGGSASFAVLFAPTSAGNLTGSISLTSNGSNSPTSVALSGTGTAATAPALTITPSSASFGNVTVGVASSQSIQLSNSGTGTLTITQVSASGAGFSLISLAALPINLTAGQTSNFNVQFLPAGTGAATGSVTVSSNAPNSPASIPLTGSGVAQTLTLSFSTTNLGFGNVNTGSSSSLPVTVTNTGNANVLISAISESGAGFTLSGASTPVTLTPNQTMTFNVVFNPAAAGTDSGTVTVTSNASGSPATIALSGTGVTAVSHSATLSWTASTSTVSGYNVYRSTTSGTGYAKINSSLVAGVSYVDNTVQSGTTYYYVATAVDSGGNESVNSNEVTAVIP